MEHWFFVHFGIAGTGSYYGFWSGFGSDLGELTLLTAIGGLYYKHNCHVKHCWRIGKHLVNGTPYCNKHHQGARDAG